VIIPEAAGHEIVLILPRATWAAAAGDWGRNVFAIAPPIDDMGVAIADQIRPSGPAQVAVLRVGGSFGERIRDSFVAGLASGEPPDLTDVVLDAADPAVWGRAASERAAAGDRALLLAGPPSAATAAARALGEPGMEDVQLWLVDWGLAPEVLVGLPPGVRARIHGVGEPALDPLLEQRFGEALPAPVGAGYDAIRRAAQAAARAPGTDWEALSSWLLLTPDASSAFGSSRFVQRRGLTVLDRAEYVPYAVFDGPDGPEFCAVPVCGGMLPGPL
jgi:ABC-type branched-subunit amino acid transport system substrate-binding protein